MVLNVPSAYYYEYGMVLEEIYGVHVTSARIKQIFDKHGITRKKVCNLFEY